MDQPVSFAMSSLPLWLTSPRISKFKANSIVSGIVNMLTLCISVTRSLKRIQMLTLPRIDNTNSQTQMNYPALPMNLPPQPSLFRTCLTCTLWSPSCPKEYSFRTMQNKQLQNHNYNISYSLTFQKHMVNGSKVNFAQDCNCWFNSLPPATQLLGPVQDMLWKPVLGRGRTTPFSAGVRSYTRSGMKRKGISSARNTSLTLPSQRHVSKKNS